MPSYYVPVSFYVEAPTLADAVHNVTDYLDDASIALISSRGITGVDVEDHQAEELVTHSLEGAARV